MPRELLEFIRAINAAKEKGIKPEDLTLKELKKFLEGEEETIVAKNKTYEPDQIFTSYKVRSLDGSLTALDLSTADLVQYNATDDHIDVVWPHTSVRFSTNGDTDGPEQVSKEEFRDLLNFIAR